MFKSENDLCNVISVAVYCNADNTMLLMADTNDHWFPCTKEVGSSWEKQATKEITEVYCLFTLLFYNLIFKIST